MTACDTQAARVLERTFELSLIPAPPLDEADRTRRVRQWWESDGLVVHTQDVGNLWACLRSGSDKDDTAAIVVAAHLDTVFDRDITHGLRMTEDGLVVGPGCGDDTVAVAALSALDALLPQQTTAPVWILATVGEEGVGDLAGARSALTAPCAPVGAFLALEGNYLGRVNTIGVGSERLRVRLQSGGGHAWEHASAPSAIHAAADIVHALELLPSPTSSKTSRNVGLIHGGESINSRAVHCAFDIDLRSEDPAALTDLSDHVAQLLEQQRPGIKVSIEQIGSRPAGGIDENHPLVRIAAEALHEIDVQTRFTAASTDANVAYAMGIPAVTLGITYGDGTHTEAEWIDPSAIPRGLYALARTVTEWSSAHRPKE